MLDFATLPPEINSARMYAGAGAAPMMAAASAWSSLADELNTTAASFGSVISMLAEEEWRGTASAAMATAAQPFVAWLNSTGAAAELAANQATASAAAYQTAYAATVPPTVVAANRLQLATLVATNFLGQNAAAIAANEAMYGEMWVQDAIAMYTYAAASSAAGALQPLTSPTPVANPGAAGAQAGAVAAASTSGTQGALSQFVSTVQGATAGLAQPAAAAPAQGFVSDFINSVQNVGIWNAIQTYSANAVNVGAWHLFAGIASAIGLASGPGQLGLVPTLVGSPAMAASAVSAAPAAAVTATPVLASAGQATTVGELSVPGSWTASTPASAAPATLTTATWEAAEESGTMAAVPGGVPSVASANRGGYGFGTPRYGFKLTVMGRPVVAG